MKILRLSILLCLLLSVIALKSQNLPGHPRLLFTEADQQRVEALRKSEPLLEDLIAMLRAEADQLLTTEDLEYKKNGQDTYLWFSREYLYRLSTLSMAYRFFPDQRYVERVDEILNYLCSLPEWNEKHYLDVAEMTVAVSIAYDWLYAELPDTTREMVKETIVRRAMQPALNEYEKGGKDSWAKRETNWNVVCNASMTIGALAIADSHSQYVNTIIENAVRYTPNCLQFFAPDGVCYEGPAYWGYTNLYLSMLLKVLTDNTGNDYALSSLPGIDKSALFFVRTVSPSGKVFNFADSGPGITKLPAFFFFSRRFEQPEVAMWYREQLRNVIDEKLNKHYSFFLSIPWYDEAKTTKIDKRPALDIYRGVNDIVVFNGNPDLENPLYLIAKGGAPRMAHQQMDCGTFIVESDGIRWTDDLGSDNYTLPGFWKSAQDGLRWHYFRNTNHAHNTLTINGNLQTVAGEAHICKVADDADKLAVSIDLSDVYALDAEKVIRTFSRVDENTMDICDHIILTRAGGEIRWSCVTKTKVESNGRSAMFMQNGKKLHIEIVQPQNAVFTTRPAETFTKQELPIRDVTMLQCVVKPTIKKVDIHIRMTRVEK